VIGAPVDPLNQEHEWLHCAARIDWALQQVAAAERELWIAPWSEGADKVQLQLAGVWLARALRLLEGA